MRLSIITAACLAACATMACAPAFNWREVPIASTPLSSLFPCKPEKESRKVNLGGRETELSMAHCKTDGVTFAVGHARITGPALAGPVLAQWREATLASMHVSTSQSSAWSMPLATPQPQSVVIDAAGTGADGRPLQLKAAWFARGSDVYAALLYGPAWGADVADAFFTGLRFR